MSRSTVQRGCLRASFDARPCRHRRPACWTAKHAEFVESRCHRSWHVHSAIPVCVGMRHGDGNQTGQPAGLCRSARPRRCCDACPQSPSRLEFAARLRLGKKALASFRISLARRSSLTSRSRALMRSRSSLVTPSRRPLSISSLRTHSCSAWGTQPILGAMDSMAAHSEGYSPRCSCTIRTARSHTSGENLFDFLFMAPSSQRLEPPQNPGRFNSTELANFR